MPLRRLAIATVALALVVTPWQASASPSNVTATGSGSVITVRWTPTGQAGSVAHVEAKLPTVDWPSVPYTAPDNGTFLLQTYWDGTAWQLISPGGSYDVRLSVVTADATDDWTVLPNVRTNQNLIAGFKALGDVGALMLTWTPSGKAGAMLNLEVKVASADWPTEALMAPDSGSYLAGQAWEGTTYAPIRAGVRYDVRAALVLSGIPGGWTQQQGITTRPDVKPGAPSITSVSAQQRTLSVSWQPGAGCPYSVDFVISYRKAGAPARTSISPQLSRSARLTLTPGRYTVTVAARSITGLLGTSSPPRSIVIH